jgi:hypothetical protein
MIYKSNFRISQLKTKITKIQKYKNCKNTKFEFPNIAPPQVQYHCTLLTNDSRWDTVQNIQLVEISIYIYTIKYPLLKTVGEM